MKSYHIISIVIGLWVGFFLILYKVWPNLYLAKGAFAVASGVSLGVAIYAALKRLDS